MDVEYCTSYPAAPATFLMVTFTESFFAATVALAGFFTVTSCSGVASVAVVSAVVAANTGVAVGATVVASTAAASNAAAYFFIFMTISLLSSEKCELYIKNLYTDFLPD